MRIFFLTLLLLAISCTPKQEPATEETQPPPVQEPVTVVPTPPSQEEAERRALEYQQSLPPAEGLPPPAEPAPATETVPTTPSAPLTPGTPPSVAPAAPSFLRGKEFLVSDRTRPDFPAPQDFEIGKLWDEVPVRTQDPDVGSLFRRFLSALGRGEVSVNLIAPAWLNAVRGPLQEVINRGWPGVAEYRIGEFVWESDGLVRAFFTLRRGKARASGVIYAEMVRGQWKITDLVADLNELGKDREPPETKFEPDSYPLLRELP